MARSITLSLFGAAIVAMFAAIAHFEWSEGFASFEQSVFDFSKTMLGFAGAILLGLCLNKVINMVRSRHGSR